MRPNIKKGFENWWKKADKTWLYRGGAPYVQRQDIQRQVDRLAERAYRQGFKAGQKKPYCGIIIWYLEKKIRQMV